MTIPMPLEDRQALPVRIELLDTGLPLKTMTNRTKTRVQLSTAELAFRIFAAFRAHPHINNVLTHISFSNWPQVERALNVILDPAASEELSPLARNIVDLMCADRGITGKILKPYFHDALERLIDPYRAERLIRHVEALFTEIERGANILLTVFIEPIQGHSS